MHLNNILTKGVWLDLSTSKKKDYNPLDYFRMGIIDEISFFFLDVENTAHCQKLGKNDAKIKRQDVRQKKIKIYVEHPQKHSRHYFESFLLTAILLIYKLLR